MIRYDKHKLKSGIKTQVRVVEGYRDKDSKMKQRTIKNFGYLEDHVNNPTFIEQVTKFNEEYFKVKKDNKVLDIKPFYLDESSVTYNYGYRFLESVYEALELDKFFNNLDTNCEFPLNTIFKYLVIQRILNPDSKRATYQLKNNMYGFDNNFELHHIYRALDIFNKVKVELQKYINDRIKEIIGRDSSYAYYDVTNYYNEIDFPKDENDLRQRGVSKEHRVDPIIQLGLFIDSNGIPISMSLFRGNTSDTKTLQPVMKEIKENYNLNRLIVVADKGLNSSSNINYIVNNKDGYVVSQIIRGKKGKRYQEKLFDESLYTYNKERTFKYQEFIEEYQIINKEGKQETKKRKVLIYWKLEDAILEARKRDDKLERAIKSLGNNAYAIKHTYEQYIKEIHTVDKTGEAADKIERVLDENKINEDALYDGYFCIITSELDYDYKKILEVYGSLWKIEESFRITKSDLEVRPIYVSNESRINGHFLTCYVALVLVRLLQYKMNYTMSVERIVRALNSSKCIMEKDGVIRVLRNETVIELEDDETIESDQALGDYLKIIEAYKCSIPQSKYRVKQFQTFLKTIKY